MPCLKPLLFAALSLLLLASPSLACVDGAKDANQQITLVNSCGRTVHVALCLSGEISGSINELFRYGCRTDGKPHKYPVVTLQDGQKRIIGKTRATAHLAYCSNGAQAVNVTYSGGSLKYKC